MPTLSLKPRKRTKSTRRQSKTLTRSTTVRPRLKLMLRTTESSPPRRNVSDSLSNTEVYQRFAIGADTLKLQRTDGSGSQPSTSGTNGMTTNGITGDHPRVVSLPSDGLGTKATGIMVVMSSNTSTTSGTDSRVTDGFSSEREYHSPQSHQEENQSADHSTSSREEVSQQVLQSEECQDARLDQVNTQPSSYGRAAKHAISLEENFSIWSVKLATTEELINGRESSGASRVQSYQERVLTITLVKP